MSKNHNGNKSQQPPQVRVSSPFSPAAPAPVVEQEQEQQEQEQQEQEQQEQEEPENPHLTAVQQEEFDPEPIMPGQYQSKAAKAAAWAASRPQMNEGPIVSAEISVPAPPRKVAVQSVQESLRMVQIYPRKTINRFRVGKSYYQITSGKKTLVPKHVAELLRQKGHL